MSEQDDEKEVKEILDGMPYVRHLVYHPESDSLFEIGTDFEMQACAENGCEDVTGDEDFEKEYAEMQTRTDKRTAREPKIRLQ